MAHAHARWTEHRTGMFRHKLVIKEEIRSVVHGLSMTAAELLSLPQVICPSVF